MRSIPTDPIEFILSVEEVDLAIAEVLSTCIINSKSVPVHYFMPDIDLDEKEPPMIVFYRSGTYPDGSRYQNERIKDNAVYSEQGNLLSFDVRDFPVPQNISYQVRTVYKTHIEGVQFQAYFARTLPREFFITIKGINYRVDNIDQVGGRYSSKVGGSYVGSQYKNFGKMDEGEREFGDIFNYRVEIYQDIHERTTVKTAREILVSVENKEE